jgi:hypothetical protein
MHAVKVMSVMMQRLLQHDASTHQVAAAGGGVIVRA